MDKIKLTLEDLEKLMEWRDNNQDFVRTCPPALSEIEVFAPSGIHFKAFREGNRILFHVYFNKKKLGKLDMLTEGVGIPKGMTKVTRNTLSPTMSISTRNELAQDVNTTYCSLMAYMTYAKENVERVPRKGVTHRAKAKRLSKPSTSFTYILHYKSKNSPSEGHHRSPQGVFGVRGHFRQYKSGKRVWIEPYQKGTGNKKDKQYKM